MIKKAMQRTSTKTFALAQQKKTSSPRVTSKSNVVIRGGTKKRALPRLKVLSLREGSVLTALQADSAMDDSTFQRYLELLVSAEAKRLAMAIRSAGS